MENKPIKRNENLVPISREHHATLLFCWKIKQGIAKEVEPKRITKYINWFFTTHLEQHFQTEEKLLFFDPEDEKVQKGLAQHQQILSIINEINHCSEEKIYDLFAQLSDLIKDHTRYEERELFPWLEKKFSANKLGEIGNVLHQEEHTAAEDYDDEFWVTPK